MKPVVMPRQVSTIQRVQRVEDAPQVECRGMWSMFPSEKSVLHFVFKKLIVVSGHVRPGCGHECGAHVVILCFRSPCTLRFLACGELGNAVTCRTRPQTTSYADNTQHAWFALHFCDEFGMCGAASFVCAVRPTLCEWGKPSEPAQRHPPY